MKYRDGYWRHREGTTVHYPQQIFRADNREGTLHALAPVHPVRDRSDLLQGPVITIDADAPAADVIRIRATHLQGSVRSHPGFTLPGLSAPIPESVEIGPDFLTVTSNRLSVEIDRATCEMRFLAGDTTLTTSGSKALGIVEQDAPQQSADASSPIPQGSHDARAHYMIEQLDLGLDEQIYGLGERFGPLVKNGQVIDIWNADGGTASELAYKNVPFYLSDAGYGVFVNSPNLVSFEVGSETTSRVQFSVEDHQLEYFVIYGETPKEILSRYAKLTGLPALPPQWSFGLWLTTSFTTEYNEETVNHFVDGMAERDLALSVFHFDCFWMKAFHWTDLVWDNEAFPEPEKMLQKLKAKGLKISAWINPYIAQESEMFGQGAELGYLVKRPDGRVWQSDNWQPGMGLVDFTNPEARAWFSAGLQRLLDMGVDTFKTDFGERIPTDVTYHDGSDPIIMHNYYTHIYNKTVFDLLEADRGVGDAVVFARSATAGGQQFPVHWAGDCESTYVAMAECLRGGLSLAMCGFGYWSHDIGGFEGTPDPDVFKRWIAFGLLSSHSRLHGSKSYRVPWLVDDESVDVLRHFVDLKLRLMPYLWGAAVEAHVEGVPMLRPMALEFPGDPSVTHLDRQYMLGERLLVAPVFSDAGEVKYYVPEGSWTDLAEGNVEIGPGWRTATCSVFELPVLVRPCTLLASSIHTEDRPDRDLTKDLLLSVYEVGEGQTSQTTVHDAEGTAAVTFVAEGTADAVHVHRSGLSGQWSAQVGSDISTRVEVEGDSVTFMRMGSH